MFLEETIRRFQIAARTLRVYNNGGHADLGAESRIPDRGVRQILLQRDGSHYAGRLPRYTAGRAVFASSDVRHRDRTVRTWRIISVAAYPYTQT